MAAGWAFDPQGWLDEPVVKVKGTGVAEVAGLPSGTRYASFRKLVESAGLRAAITAAHARQQGEEKPSPVRQGRAGARGASAHCSTGSSAARAILPLPVADPMAPGSPRRACLPRRRSPTSATASATAAPADYPSRDEIDLELAYNARRPTRFAWILLVAAAIAAALLALERPLQAALGRRARHPRRLRGDHLGARGALADRRAASRRRTCTSRCSSSPGASRCSASSRCCARQRMLVFNAAATAALATLLLDLLPIDPFIHPMPPVLSGTPWLAIHVPIIMLGYASLAMVTVFAPPGGRRRDLRAGAPRARRALGASSLYWYTHVGSILLLAGILTGSIWAASSWGRYWGWDPKEVWSLVAFLAYMAILHARSDVQIQRLRRRGRLDRRLLDDPDDLPRGQLRARLGPALLRLRQLEPGAGRWSLIALVEAVFLGAGALAYRRRMAAAGGTRRRRLGRGAARGEHGGRGARPARPSSAPARTIVSSRRGPVETIATRAPTSCSSSST